ncbi:hypothetical protein Q9189_006536 [Teloschistes chrysophthalmus]
MPAVRSGNYVMSGCGERNGELAALLSRLQQSLYTARQISTKSTVFEKFFHGVNPATVTRILSTIATGGDINFDGQPFEPTIICASSEMPGLADQWGVCQSPSVVASSRPGYRFVFLCPRFWGLLKRVPDALDCVGTLPNGHISVGQGLARTQLSILLHELVTIYIASAGLKPLHPQVWALHDVLDLPPTKSYLNPANYAFFVASTQYQDTLQLYLTTDCDPFLLRYHCRM